MFRLGRDIWEAWLANKPISSLSEKYYIPLGTEIYINIQALLGVGCQRTRCSLEWRVVNACWRSSQTKPTVEILLRKKRMFSKSCHGGQTRDLPFTIIFERRRHRDTMLLGTGYELRRPFLEHGHSVYTDPSASLNQPYTEGLLTNL